MFFLIVATGLVLTFFRYTHGLGSVTHLSSKYPWGLWKALNVLCGVGLGAAGFTLMGVVYIFHAERYRPIVRPATIMAFLAYSSVIVGLFLDIGRSWAIWHPIVMWNTHSVLFDIAWCLMLYTTVLMLEGSGMLFEKLGWPRMVKIQHAVSLPVVILGILLSTMHQSSLGGLFVIAPEKMHLLWYSQLLPLLFFLSAVGVGIAMLIIMSRLSSRVFGRQHELPLMIDLGRLLVAALAVYGATRLFDLGRHGVLGLAIGGGYEAHMFQLEFGAGVLLPFLLLSIPRMRRSLPALYGCSLLVVFGFILNRLNVCITSFEAHQGGHYLPAWSEVVMSLMVIALAFGAFCLLVKFLPVYPDQTESTGPVPAAVEAPPRLRSSISVRGQGSLYRVR